MKTIIKLEEIGMLGLSIYAFSLLNFEWWWFPVLILAPDISMVGYIVNTSVGALIYNFVHHKGVACVVLLIGFYFNLPIVELAGIILFGHSSMDRLFGYGLKYADDFKHTSLGWIGKENKN